MLVDDEPAQLRLVSALAQRAGWRTVTAAGPDMALARLSSRDGAMLDAVLIDSATGEVASLIAEMRERRARVPILLLTATESVELAVAAMRAGASDYLVKPVSPERLMKALDAAVAQGVDGGELRSLAEKLPAELTFDNIVGAAPKFRAALELAGRAAKGSAPVLIDGEAGVGKELLARAIHDASPRAHKPFDVVPCGALPANLIESVLFGHEAGAFTGAFTRAVGKLSECAGGTLVLDQIEALPPEAQERLLEFIGSGEVRPMNGVAHLTDTRLIAASDRSLAQAARQAKFRPDLLAKLSDTHISLPPLRDRLSDLPELVEHLLARIAEQPGLRRLGISDGAMALLKDYDWPGNVRQLQATLFRAAVLCDDDELDADDFPQVAARRTVAPQPPPRRVPSSVNLFDEDGHMRTLEELEGEIIRIAINHYRGRMSEVARRLGIGRSTLYRRLVELGLTDAA